MKRRQSEFLLIVSAILIVCGLFAVLSWLFPERWGCDIVTTTEEVRVDTIRDTIYVDKPVLVDASLLRYDSVRLPKVRDKVYHGGVKSHGKVYADADSVCADYAVDSIPDSADVAVPITQSVYEGAQYRAWVSGYHASLDSIHLYVEQTNATRTITRTIREPRKPIVVSVGIGYGLNGSKAQPWVGVHVGYRLFEL